MKEIKDYPGYYISEDGKIFSSKSNRFLKTKGGDASRYSQVCIVKDKKSKVLYVHRLLAEAFIPNPYNKPCINHKDRK